MLGRRSTATLHTSTYWYFRACRAEVEGAGGKLSGPFEELAADEQRRAIAAMLDLPPDVGLPEPRLLVPAMVGVAGRHQRLNLMNIEATAAALVLEARLLISPDAARGVLPSVLEAERIRWDVYHLTG